MKNQKTWSLFHRPRARRQSRHFVAAQSIVLVGVMIASNIIAIVQPASAAQTATEYCAQYSSNDQKNACKAGVNGQEDCNDYATTFGQAVGDVCYKAASDRVAGLVTTGSVTVTPSPSPSASPTPSTSASPSPSASPSSDGFKLTELQNILDQTQSLSDYIDVLHQAGPDADVDTDEAADNNYGSYINGAGNKQEIKVINPGSGGSPAILFFNGGGWHANDCMGQRVAAGGGKDCSNIGGDAEKAGDRGYAMFDVTYRLGSSSVYYAFEDVMRGIQHMRNNADMYGIDANKIAIWGDSAGGSLSMRAAASGRSGAKAAVGWSAPTNAYTAAFKSIQSFAVGVDHSTCAPTDLAGFANFADLATGGSGDVAQYGQGLSSNDVSALGINLDGSSAGSADPLTLLTQGVIAGKNLLSAAGDMESISSQISSGDPSSLGGSAFSLASKKFVECLDNFNALSPALFASPDSAPSFLAGFEDDGLIDPTQSYGMRDKLRQLGIKSDALVLPGGQGCLEVAAAPAGAGGCHLGYYKDFVCKTLNFIDSLIQPERGETDCGTGVAENQGSNDVATAESGEGGSGSSGGAGGGSGSSNSGDSSGNSGTSGGQSAQQRCEANGGTYVGNSGNATEVCRYQQTAQQKCESGGGSWADRRGTGNPSCSYPPTQQEISCVTWEQGCYDAPQTQSGTATSSNSICPGGQKYVYTGGGYCSNSCPMNNYVDKGTYCARVVDSQ